MTEQRTKSALVTGASRGIGRSIAVALAEAGFRVFCVSTREGGCDETVTECRAKGVEASAIACDVSNAEQVEAMAKDVLAEAGSLDALVNNAGITRDGLLMRMGDADFDDVIGVNLRGTFLVCRAFSRSMSKVKKGRIVNVGSIVGVRGNAGQVNYAASKAGLIGLTKSMAQEMGGRGVTANLVAPGFIETDMTAELGDGIRDRTLQNIPLGRLGVAEDVAAAVAFLCSDAASYITGQVLMVDGGLAM